MGKFWDDTKDSIIVFRQLEKHGGVIGSILSFNGYGTSEEIEKEYDLLIPQEKLNEYNSLEEVFKMAESK